MPIANTDILFCLSANHAEADTGAQGGAIDPTGRALDDQFSAAARPEFVSSAAGDTQNCTVVGRLASGAIDTEVNALTGTTPVYFTKTFERILKVTLASAAVGVITMKEGTGGTTRHTFAIDEDLCRCLFYAAAAEASGGSPVVRYEKVFILNNHATLAALDLSAELTTDPRTDYDIVVEDAVDDNEQVTNRLTAPTGITGVFSDGPHDCVAGDLEAGVAQGLWLRQTLAAGESPAKDEPVVTVPFNTA